MKAISKKEFSKLDINQKAVLIFNEGRYIAVRYYYNQYINLYLYNDYFVEVWYHPNQNKIKQIELSSDEKILNQYITNMNNQSK